MGGPSKESTLQTPQDTLHLEGYHEECFLWCSQWYLLGVSLANMFCRVHCVTMVLPMVFWGFLGKYALWSSLFHYGVPNGILGFLWQICFVGYFASLYGVPNGICQGFLWQICFVGFTVLEWRS
jgi:hypothetical protein